MQEQDAKIRLHPEDAISIRLWMDRLRDNGALTFYKDKIDRPPPGSALQPDAYVLCIQTKIQLDTFQRIGHGFIGIDVTHNTTQYDQLLLFTIIAWDHLGRGEYSIQ